MQGFIYTRRPFIRDCGLMDYQEALRLQRDLLERRISGGASDVIVIAEHPPVITLGARDSANILVAEETVLAERNISLVRVRRGGGATAHNPGQLVVYPIVNLRGLGLDISGYVRKLEGIGVALLSEFGIQAVARRGMPGIWVQDRKIASVGIRVKRGVTFHGMAINVNNDLEIFNLIIPCGLSRVRMTSTMEETGRKADMEELKLRISALLAAAFYGP